MFAVAAPGISGLLANECEAMGLAPHEVSHAGVALQLDLDSLFLLNCWSRLASRVIVRLGDFEARTFASLERSAERLPWDLYISPKTPVQIRVTCRKSRLYHSDAVAERIGRVIDLVVPGSHVNPATDCEDEHGARSVGGQIHHRDEGDSPLSQLILVRLERDHCTISVDSSGPLLHRRGWRLATAKAPLRETLAAAMLAAVDWQGEVPLVDPFCGSGTIGIEAALRARHVAPGLSRRFVMEYWPVTDTAACDSVRKTARTRVRPGVGVPVILQDRDAGAIRAVEANARRAGVLQDIVVTRAALSNLDLKGIGTRGMILTNPPYGNRVSSDSDLRPLFARFGDILRGGGNGWNAAMLMPRNTSLLRQLRMPLSSLFTTSNGGLSVELLTSGKQKPQPWESANTQS